MRYLSQQKLFSFRRSLKKAVLSALLVVLAMPLMAAERWVLPERFPSNVTHGLQLMRNTELRQAMHVFNAALEDQPKSVLRILHNKENVQRAWAEQLRDWLLVLGVQPENIELHAAKKWKQQLALEINQP